MHQSEDCVYESVIIVRFEWIDSSQQNERTPNTKATTNSSNKLNNIIIIIISECDCEWNKRLYYEKAYNHSIHIERKRDLKEGARTHNWVKIIFIYVHFLLLLLLSLLFIFCYPFRFSKVTISVQVSSVRVSYYPLEDAMRCRTSGSNDHFIV